MSGFRKNRPPTLREPVLVEDSKFQARATRALRETIQAQQCAATKKGLRCVGKKGHEGSHWCWTIATSTVMTWEDNK